MSRNSAQHMLADRFYAAIIAFRASTELQSAAATLGMGEREYAERFVALNFGPLTWTSSSTHVDPPLSVDDAYRTAVDAYERSRR